MDNKETILCTEWSEGWDSNMPAILIEYPDGTMDLCIQTGDHFDKLFKKAKIELDKRDLMVVDDGENSVGSLGAYFGVCPRL